MPVRARGRSPRRRPRPGRTVGQVVQRHHAAPARRAPPGPAVRRRGTGSSRRTRRPRRGRRRSTAGRRGRSARPPPRTRAGTEPRIPVWNRNGCSSRTRNWLNVNPAGARPRDQGGEPEDVGGDLVDLGLHGGLLVRAGSRRAAADTIAGDRRHPHRGEPPSPPPFVGSAGLVRRRRGGQAHGQRRRLGPAADAQLGQDPADVVLGGLRRDEEPRGDLGVGEPWRTRSSTSAPGRSATAATSAGPLGSRCRPRTPSARSRAAARSRPDGRSEPFEARERGARLGDGARVVARRGQHLGQLEADAARAGSGRSSSAEVA